MPRKPPEGLPVPLGLDRVVFFSDAVIAIAITVLVLDLRVPEVAGELASDPGRALGYLWPKVLGYVVSFWVIALYWVAHHRCFRYIRRYDRRLMYINFLFLMFIAFMPFPTGLLFSSAVRTLPVMLYAGTAAGMGLSLALLWIYAVRRGFVAADTPRATIRDIRLNLLLPPIVFLLSAGVALLNPVIAMYLWLLLIPVYVLRRHLEIAVIGDEAP
jgi:TMEM175 potassium channel family protein